MSRWRCLAVAPSAQRSPLIGRSAHPFVSSAGRASQLSPSSIPASRVRRLDSRTSSPRTRTVATNSRTAEKRLIRLSKVLQWFSCWTEVRAPASPVAQPPEMRLREMRARGGQLAEEGPQRVRPDPADDAATPASMPSQYGKSATVIGGAVRCRRARRAPPGSAGVLGPTLLLGLATVVGLARASMGAAALAGFRAPHAHSAHSSLSPFACGVPGHVSPAQRDSPVRLREHGRVDEPGWELDAGWRGGAAHASAADGLFSSFVATDEHGHAQDDEVPGTHPFSADLDELATWDLDAEVQDAEHPTVSPGGRLPPSGQWDKVPERNSLAHMRLLNELDGRLPSEPVQSQTLHAAAAPSHQASARGVLEPVRNVAQPSSPFPQAGTLAEQHPWQAVEEHADEQLDLMTPFGAPVGCGQGRPGDVASAQLPPPLHLPASSSDALGAPSADDEMECEGAEMECEGALAAPEQRVVGHVRVADEDLRPEQLLLQWEEAERREARREGKKVLPCQRIDANVRDFVARARFAAGQSDTASASVGRPGRADATVWQGGGGSGDDAAQGWGGNQEDDWACPGSPVSSLWSQDPCGYWVQDGVCGGGGEEVPGDLDLASWPEATGAPPQQHAASRFAIRRDGSSVDLWSTVDGEERDLSSQHLELEKMAAAYQGDARQDGMVGVGGGADAAGQQQGQQWCDRFVPRPLQLEFARELRWFAWQGRDSARHAPATGRPENSVCSGRPENSACKLAGKAGRRAKTSRKQLVPHLLLPPFGLSLPRSLSFGALPTLPTSLRLRAAATDSAGAGEDDEMEESNEGESEENGAALGGQADAECMSMGHDRMARGPGSRRACCADKKSGRNASRSIRGAASCAQQPASSSRTLSMPSTVASISSASVPAKEHPCRASARSNPPGGLAAPASAHGSACDRFEAGAGQNDRLVGSGVLEKFELLAVSVAGRALGANALDLQTDTLGGRGEGRSCASDEAIAKSKCNRVVHGASSAGVKRLDEVQMFKIREMLREMHRSLMSMPRPLLVGDADLSGDRRQGAERGACAESGACQPHREVHTWRLVMYDAMMHAQSLVAAAGHATVNDGIAILDRMAAAGVPPTRQTYNKCLAVVAGAASHGQGNGTHAADIFVRMTQAGIEPDTETYWEWLSVLGSAIYHGQATMQEVFAALRDLNERAARASAAGASASIPSASIMCKAPHDKAHAQEALVHEDVKCLQLCLRAAVGGARRGLAGKADVEWVLRRMRSLQLEADHDTWVLAMQVLVNAALRGDASVVSLCLDLWGLLWRWDVCEPVCRPACASCCVSSL